MDELKAFTDAVANVNSAHATLQDAAAKAKAAIDAKLALLIGPVPQQS